MELRFDEKHCYRFDAAVHVTPNSELYKAMDVSMGRNVALKKIVISGNNSYELRENYKRAIQEVRTMVQISELSAKVPNIFSTYFEERTHELYIVMQWISGETLSEKMKRNVQPIVFLRWLQELCKILDAMSQKHFRHKDIKPDNIMFNENDDLYLIDFNISVSVPNQMEGTMFYKAPEMDFGSTTVSRERVDMFSIGVMMYEYFADKVPVRMVDYECYTPQSGKWDLYVEAKQVNPQIDRKCNEVIKRLMSYHPDDRYRTYAELINDLKEIERNMKNAGRYQGRS